MDNLISIQTVSQLSLFGLLSFLVYRNTKSVSNIPQFPGGSKIFGNLFGLLHAFRDGTVHLFFDLASKTDNPIVNMYLPGISMNGTKLISDPDFAKQILALRHTEFVRDERLSALFKGICNYALFLIPSPSDQWKKHRKLLQPAFGPTHLRNSFIISLHESNELMKVWEGYTDKERSEIELTKALNFLATDVIGRVGFSYNFHLVETLVDPGVENKNQKYLLQMAKAFPIRRFTPKFMWRVLGATPEQIKGPVSYLKGVIKDVVEDKEQKFKENIVPVAAKDMDLLDRLMENSTLGGKFEKSSFDLFTQEELEDEVFAFFLAGQGVREEAKELLNGEKLTYEKLNDLKFTDAVIKETLRLYPIVPALQKKSNVDTTLGGYNIKKGDNLSILVYSLQRNEKYWKDGNEFVPERWLGEEKNVVNGTYLPFGEGPTNCIGQKLAVIEMKTVISTICLKYDMELASAREDLKIESKGTLRLKNGLKVKVSRV
ncbi:hypothetical protein HK099_004542 [Clydaea vesicula]|uniref:Cytochrome P450 n=1 Tax=Clydaea vesicula TaxID=447962 RepID=A0AAD5Y076_9FUNG|nr:hypothetical protein HK099_004542 [Clydaea vesicula]